MRLDQSPAWKALTTRLESQAPSWAAIPKDFLAEVLSAYGVAPCEGGQPLDPVDVLIALHAARVSNYSPKELARAVDGEVEIEILYVPRRSVMREGYELLKKMSLWAASKSQSSVPASVQVVLRWLRDHYGSKDVIEEAKKRLGKSLFDKPVEGAPPDE